jgi:hypothetical protein
MENAMHTQILKHTVAALAAAATTLVLFHSVASVADHGRAAWLAAQMKPMTMASSVAEAKLR